MKKQLAEFATIVNNGIIIHIGKSCIEQPQIRYNQATEGIKWFDDSVLIRKN